RDIERRSAAIPSRVILVRASAAAAEQRLEAWVSARCRLTDEGRRHLCSEEIRIEAAGPALAEAPSLVLSLLAPDVPSALFWSAELETAGDLLPEWCGAADRFVIDSARFRDNSGFARFLSTLTALSRRPVPGDLHWQRL